MPFTLVFAPTLLPAQLTAGELPSITLVTVTTGRKSAESRGEAGGCSAQPASYPGDARPRDGQPQCL